MSAPELLIASRVAGESNCVRRQVGAILKDGERIVAYGWNSVHGVPSCATVCPRAKHTYKEVPAFSDYSKGSGACYSVHAEMAAIAMAGKGDIDVRGLTMWVTCQPCPDCAVVLADMGVKVVWPEGG